MTLPKTLTLAFTAVLALGAGTATAQSAEDALPPVIDEGLVDRVDPLLIAYDRIQDFLAGLDSYQASFRQINPGGTVATGTLYLQQPGRIRFDYDGDVPFLVVADGEVLSFVDYEVGQVTRWPVNDTPLKLFLADTPDLAGLGAQIQLNPAGLEDHVAIRARDPENPDQGTITVFFRDGAGKSVSGGTEGGALTLVSWVVEDAQGRITVVEVTDPQANPDLKASLWTFKDPRGLAKRRRAR